MFGKRVSAVIWNDPRRKDARTKFVANYIFEDGFSSIEEAKASVPHPERFVYLEFCDHWYAICCDSYYSEIVVTRDKVFYQDEAFAKPKPYPRAEFEFPMVGFHNSGRTWTDGIYQDLLRIDAGLCVYGEDGVTEDPTTVVNTVIAFGLLFFTNEIAIKTDYYLRHVLPHYFSEKSLGYMWGDIVSLRKKGYSYWNPYSGECSKTDTERKRKRSEAERGIDMGEIIDDRQVVFGRKVMDASDLF